MAMRHNRTASGTNAFTELQKFTQPRGHRDVPRIHAKNTKLAEWVNTQRSQYKLLRGDKTTLNYEKTVKLEKLGFQSEVLEATRLTQWEDRFSELKEFKQKHGHTRVPSKYPPNPSLGNWVHRQRVVYSLLNRGKRANLPVERMHKLNKLGFHWVYDISETWNRHFSELQEFKKEWGHCNVPHKYDKSPKLGSSVSTQRTQYSMLKRGKKSTISDEKVEKLEELGFQWKSINLGTWEDKFTELREFKIKHGHTCVPIHYPTNQSLGCWVEKHRSQYSLLKRGKKAYLSGRRAQKLDEIGFQWSLRNSETGNEHFSTLKQEWGRCDDPKIYDRNSELAEWVRQQRNQCTPPKRGEKSVLNCERKPKQKDLGFQFKVLKTTHGEQWEDRFSELKEFKQKYGHTCVPNKYPPNPSLGHWVRKQRALFNHLKNGGKRNLSVERVKRLNELNFQWGLRNSATWNKHFSELQEFKQEWGHCNVPQKYEQCPKLGSWVNTQRTQYALLNKGDKSMINDERMLQLETLGFQWKVKKSINLKKWEDKFTELKVFKEKHGHAWVPNQYPQNPSLGYWVDKQISQYILLKSGGGACLPVERAQKLEELGFQWTINNKSKYQNKSFSVVSKDSSCGNFSHPSEGGVRPCKATLKNKRPNFKARGTQRWIDQIQRMGLAVRTNMNLASINWKVKGLSDWDPTGKRASGSSTMKNDWEKTATAREQCVKMATIDANQGFGNICAIEKEERALLEGHIRRQRMLIEECRKELCCSVQVPPQQLNVQDGTDN